MRLKCPYCNMANQTFSSLDGGFFTMSCKCYKIKSKSVKQLEYLWNKWVAEQNKIIEHKASEKQGRLF